MKFKACDVALANTKRIKKNNVMFHFQQIVSQQQNDVNCFNFLNKIVEESNHNASEIS